jgi:hypothetical protein
MSNKNKFKLIQAKVVVINIMSMYETFDKNCYEFLILCITFHMLINMYIDSNFFLLITYYV